MQLWNNYAMHIYAFMGNLNVQSSTEYTRGAKICKIFKVKRVL